MAKKPDAKKKATGMKVSKVKVDDKGKTDIDDADLKEVAGGMIGTGTNRSCTVYRRCNKGCELLP